MTQVKTPHEQSIGSRIVTYSGPLSGEFEDPGTVSFWDAATGEQDGFFRDDTGMISEIAYAPDGKTIATGRCGYGEFAGLVRLWDLGTRTERLKLTGHAGGVNSLAYSPDGKTLAVSSREKLLKLWDPATGRERLTIQDLASPIGAMAYSPDGRWLALGTYDGFVSLRDPSTGRELMRFKHGKSTYSVAFSPDSKSLVSAGDDPTIKIWAVDAKAEPSP
jgi:WD40 repeat protein